MKHISKWTRRDYFKGLILLYFFSFFCLIVLGCIIDGIGTTIKELGENLGEVRVWFRLIIIAIIIEIFLIIFFLPSLIAKFKRKRNSAAIFALNLPVFGGGFIGFITAYNLYEYNLYEYKSQLIFIICFMGGVWMASLIWALCNENKQS